MRYELNSDKKVTIARYKLIIQREKVTIMRIQFKDFNSTEFKRVKIVRYKQNSEEKDIVMIKIERKKSKLRDRN